MFARPPALVQGQPVFLYTSPHEEFNWMHQRIREVNAELSVGTVSLPVTSGRSLTVLDLNPCLPSQVLIPALDFHDNLSSLFAPLMRFLLLSLILSTVTPSLAVIQVGIAPVVFQCFQASISCLGCIPPLSYSYIQVGGSNNTPESIGTSPGGDFFPWIPNKAIGTQGVIQITDSTGATGQSEAFTVQSGPDTSCLTSTSSSTQTISSVSTPSSSPTTSLIQTSTSGSSGGTASTTSPSNSPRTTTSSNRDSDGASTAKTVVTTVQIVIFSIMGIVAVVVITTIIIVCTICRRRRKRKALASYQTKTEFYPLAGSKGLSFNPSVAASSSPSGFQYYSHEQAAFSTPSVPPTPDIASTPITYYDMPPQGPVLQRSSTRTPAIALIPPTAPPAYEPMHDSSIQEHTVYPPSPSTHHSLHKEDEIGKYAAAHRDIIPHDLETKLREAKYLPGSNPRDIPVDTWVNQHGVTRPELKRLQVLFDR